MSWMDSWSRPTKSQATPPPFYLLPGGDKVLYCKACGRLIGDRKAKTASSSTPPKYCSSRCKSTRPNKILERKIEDTFVALLNGQSPNRSRELPIQTHDSKRTSAPPFKGGPAPGNYKKKKKGESRNLVQCSEVEEIVFGDRNEDPEKRFGRRKNRARRGVKDGEVWKSVDMISDEEVHNSDDPSDDEDNENSGGVSVNTFKVTEAEPAAEIDPDVVARLSIRSGTRIRPSQNISQVNGGVGGEKGLKERISETEEMLVKRREGQKKAEERELVRCIARRGVAFGFLTSDGKERMLCEAVMLRKVVESSFAKGEWGVRWRE